MPVPAPPSSIAIYRACETLPPSLVHALRANERYTNTILPHILTADPLSNQLWISSSGPGTVDLVLAVTTGPLGHYPVFIVTTRPFPALTYAFLYPRLAPMVAALSRNVPAHRVFSVFAPEPITRVFAELWTDLTGIRPYAEPYYAARVSFCTSALLTPAPDQPADYIYDARLGTESDIPKVAQLCYEFALTSPPFILSKQGAYKEASVLIRNSQLWVLSVADPQHSDIASIVAVTRSSPSVAVITKVYTNPRWRKRGCAERLVRKVCKSLLTTKDYVMLYVGHDNRAASVYHKIGFAGLEPGSVPPSIYASPQHMRDHAGMEQEMELMEAEMESIQAELEGVVSSSAKQASLPPSYTPGVDPWLELGFDRNFVKLGHW